MLKAPSKFELTEYAVTRFKEGAERHTIVKEVRSLSEYDVPPPPFAPPSRRHTECMGLRDAILLVQIAWDQVCRDYDDERAKERDGRTA